MRMILGLKNKMELVVALYSKIINKLKEIYLKLGNKLLNRILLGLKLKAFALKFLNI
jgi:hypothetical protein